MTTKKQRREASLAKREKRLAEEKANGLAAQKSDHERRRNKLRDSQKDKHNKEHDWKVLDKDCVLCQDTLKEARRQQQMTEVAENG